MTHTIRTATRTCTLAALAVAMTAAIVITTGQPAPPSLAQELPPIADVRDLSVRLDTEIAGNNLFVYVHNNSTVPMRNVQVRLTTDPPEARARLRADPELYDSSSGIITFPELSASAYTHDTRATHNPSIVRGQIWYPTGHRGVAKVRAEIIGSVPAEDATKLDNNQAELWINFSTSGSFQVRSNTSISAEVVNRSPAQGENHVFRVRASEVTPRDNETENYDVDVVVKVALSEGLAFASGHSASSGTSFSPTTGLWRLGSGARVTGTLEIPVRLTTDAGAAPPLNRRCLSAQIVGGRPPATAHEHGKVHTTCLGASKPIIFSDGDRLIRLWNCSPGQLYPCREGDARIVVVFPDLSGDSPRSYRAEDVIFLVDPVAHQTAGTTNGTSWLWSTGQSLTYNHQNYDLPGVRLTRRTGEKPYTRSREFTISDVSPKERPGTIAIVDRYISNGAVELYEALNPDKSDKLTDAIDDSWTQFDYPHLVVFSAPGVYKVNLGIEWTRKSDSSVDSASSTLTFVVGALADLQVHDAGLHGTLPEGQQAYTLRAENNIEGTVELVEVALTGVPREAVPEVSSDGGRYDRGACDENDLCAGIWKIGDLEGRDDRYFSGRSDGPTLTLLVEGNPDPITATITSEQTRTVTAGENSYTIEVTDVDDSNSKDVSVAVGTGRGEPDPEAPKSLRVDQFGRIALLRWETVEKVSRWPVAYYQVERDNRVLDVEPKEALYLDLRERGGNSVYRVRAVNEFGDPGPWSLPAGGSDVLAQTAELAAPTSPTATVARGEGRVDLSWFAPAGETGLSYRIEYATDGAGPWRILARSHGGTTYSHTGLLSGVTYHYRVAAVRANVISPWAYVQATTEGVEVNTPGWPENLRFTSIDRTAVTLAWDPPVNDGGSRVTGYEYRVFGPCASGADAVCDIVSPTRVSGTSRRIGLPNREGTYEFSVRALNAVGAGDWSQSISKEVGPATAGGGRVVLSPSRLTVTEGGEATYRVKLSTSPTLPLFVTLHWDGTGDENLGGELPVQQFKILLPSGYDTSGLPEMCGGVPLDRGETYAWNAGAPITVVAAEDDDSESETLTILHDIATLPHDCLGMTEDEWSPDPVYDGMQGPALTVTERDND